MIPNVPILILGIDTIDSDTIGIDSVVATFDSWHGYVGSGSGDDSIHSTTILILGQQKLIHGGACFDSVQCYFDSGGIDSDSGNVLCIPGYAKHALLI